MESTEYQSIDEHVIKFNPLTSVTYSNDIFYILFCRFTTSQMLILRWQSGLTVANVQDVKCEKLIYVKEELMTIREYFIKIAWQN